jgi:hypothetical protein
MSDKYRISDRIWCEDCKYVDECEKHYGKIGVDKEDCTAIVGSHFCRKSWDGFECYCCNKSKETKKTT